MSVSLIPSDCLYFNRTRTTEAREITISNPNAQPVAFKVKTTAPKSYWVKPNMGEIEPGESMFVKVGRAPLKEEAPLPYVSKGKFLVQSRIMPVGKKVRFGDIWTAAEDGTAEKKIHQQKLRVKFLPQDQRPADIVQGESSREGKISTSVSLIPSDCLYFNRTQPTEPREIMISNPNAQPVVFKVKTTAPKNYWVKPNMGEIEPGESMVVKVGRAPLKEEPPLSYVSKDKFLVQSRIMPVGKNACLEDIWTAAEDGTAETKVHQQKLRVKLLPQDQRPPEIIEEESWGEGEDVGLLAGNPTASMWATVSQALGGSAFRLSRRLVFKKTPRTRASVTSNHPQQATHNRGSHIRSTLGWTPRTRASTTSNPQQAAHKRGTYIRSTLGWC